MDWRKNTSNRPIPTLAKPSENTMKCTHLNNSEIREQVNDDGDSFSIDGCCGGQCVVIKGIKYCPFCGEKL